MYARDCVRAAVHNGRMDTEWFKARKKAVRVNDQKLADAVGRDRSVITRVINGDVRFDLSFVEPFARLLAVSSAEILEHAGVPPTNASALRFEGASLETVEDSLPVWGTGLGAAREIDGVAVEQTTLNTGDVTEYVKRPAILKGKKGAYALHVQGSSMHPALPDGEMVVAVRDMPLSVGDNVVVYLRNGDPSEDDGASARAVLVKELVRRSASYVELRQYDPAKDFRIAASEVLRIDRILTRREMLT